MSGIIYDARRIKAYEKLMELGQIVGKSQEFLEALWKAMVFDGELMAEFTYYLDYHAFLDEMKCEGYGLTDMYMWLMGRYNLMQDYGKNDQSCGKDALVLDAFYHMTEMKKQPEEYIRRLNDDFGLGMDRF